MAGVFDPFLLQEKRPCCTGFPFRTLQGTASLNANLSIGEPFGNYTSAYKAIRAAGVLVRLHPGGPAH